MDFRRAGAAFFLLVVQLLYGTRAQLRCLKVISLTPSAPNATVYMPNYYDASYPPTPYTCTWRVPAPTGYNVRLTLRDVNTTSSETLTVFSRPTTSGTYVMALTGPLNYPIAPLISHSGLSLRYRSEVRRRDGRGFLADLSLTEEAQNPGAMSCGGKIFLSESEPAVDIRAPYSSNSVSVPLSPKPFGQATCRWVVEAPLEKRIKIIWNKVDTKNEAIRVYDRKTMRSTGRTTKLKGQINQGLAPFISSSNGILFILEREGALDVGNGFHVTVEMTDNVMVPSSCGGTYFLDESQLPTLDITSPYYDELDGTSGGIISCWWYLNAPAGKQIRLEIEDIHTTPFETLKIFDGRYEAEKTPLGFMYGDEGPHSLVSTEGGMLVYLEDRRLFGQNGRGFTSTASISDNFSWDLPETNPSCGQVVYLDTNQPRYRFSSLNFPTSTPNNGYTCYWTFHSPPGTQLMLNLDHIQLISQSLSVNQDGIQLFEIENIPSPVANRLQTGNNESQVVFTGREHINLLQGGFRAEMTFVPKGFTNWTLGEMFTDCGGVINLNEALPTLTITTPDYPMLTGAIHACTWVIRVPSGSKVDVTYCDLAIDAPGAVRAFDGPNLEQMMFQKSGSDVPSPVTTTGNEAIIQYESRGRTVGRGAKFVVTDSNFEPSIDPCTLLEIPKTDTTTGAAERRTPNGIQAPADVFPSLSGVNVVCDSTHMTVYLNRSLFAPDTNPNALQFKDDKCVAFRHDSDHLVLSTRYDRCQTMKEQTTDYIMFSNVVKYTHVVPIPGTLITRDKKNVFIRTRCQLHRRQIVSSFPNNVGGDVSEFSEVGFGNFSLGLQRFTDASFTRTKNESTIVVPNQRLFYAVNLTTNPGFVFYIDDCWATPSSDPLDEQQQDLINSGCETDITLTMYTNFTSSLRPFSFEASTISGGDNQVYVHCEAIICYANDVDSRCSRGCLNSNSIRNRRRVNQVDIEQSFQSIPHVVSQGPVYFNLSD